MTLGKPPRTNSFTYILYHNILRLSSYICVTKHKISKLPIYKGTSLLGKKRHLYPIQSPNTVPVGCDLGHSPDVIYLYYRFSCWMCKYISTRKLIYKTIFTVFKQNEFAGRHNLSGNCICPISVILKLSLFTPTHLSVLGMYSFGVRQISRSG